MLTMFRQVARYPRNFHYILIFDEDVQFDERKYTLNGCASIPEHHCEAPEQVAEFVLSLLPQYNTNLLKLMYS